LQADKFCARFDGRTDARFDDYATRSTGHKTMQAICAPVCLRRVIFIVRRLPGIEQG